MTELEAEGEKVKEEMGQKAVKEMPMSTMATKVVQQQFQKALPQTVTQLTESMYFLSANQKQVIQQRKLSQLVEFADQLPGFVPARIVASACGFGTSGVDSAEEAFGPYVWATEFENVHSFWNFVEPGFQFLGHPIAGSEQLFQAQKVGDVHSKEFREWLPKFANVEPIKAFSLGQSVKLREDWEKTKDDAMRLAIREKFLGNSELRNLLLSTYPFPLVSVKSDRYWGTGSTGTGGRNRLGVLLMELREEMVKNMK